MPFKAIENKVREFKEDNRFTPAHHIGGADGYGLDKAIHGHTPNQIIFHLILPFLALK